MSRLCTLMHSNQGPCGCELDQRITREDFSAELSAAGFAEHEIEELWSGGNHERILKAVIADGERDLSA